MSYRNKYEERIIHRGYKKDKKKRKTRKSDHKHDYEEVIGVREFMGRDRATPYYICRICGKEEMKEFCFNEKINDYLIRMVSGVEEVERMHPELRVVRLKEK